MGTPVKFDYEWQEAPGVRDQVLAATWARFSIEVGAHHATEAIDPKAGSRRTGIYGSLFPLAQWIVENWWHLLYEPAPVSPPPGGRDSWPELQRPWIRRHNLLVAREGGAYPDLTIARDGDVLSLIWRPDPSLSFPTRLRFVGEGSSRVAVERFEEEASSLVGAVLARLESQLPGNSEVEDLKEAWMAIGSSDSSEKDLCRALAILGLDPYDPEEVTDEITEAVQQGLRNLPPDLNDDLLESKPQHFREDLDWVLRQAAGLKENTEGFQFPTIELIQAATPHETGYLTARRVRAELLKLSSDEPIPELEPLLAERLGWSQDFLQRRLGKVSLDGMVGLDEASGAPVLIDPKERKRDSSFGERFLVARAAFFPITKTLGSRARLLSHASTPAQRMTRAFAAEILAPSAALKKMVSGQVSEDQLGELAAKFKVSSLAIAHQIENHRLGYVAA